MRKLRVLLLLFISICLVFGLYRFDLYYRREQNKQLDKVHDESIKYGRTISRLDDTAIIKKALKEVGVLAVLEGEEQYKQLIEEENWYSYRGINIDWRYRFAISMDLENINIKAVEGKVQLGIDKDKLVIQFIEKTKESKSHSEASWFAQKYSSQELSALDKAVAERIEVKIKTTPSYWERAEKSLKERLAKICNNLGYLQVEFT